MGYCLPSIVVVVVVVIIIIIIIIIIITDTELPRQKGAGRPLFLEEGINQVSLVWTWNALSPTPSHSVL